MKKRERGKKYDNGIDWIDKLKLSASVFPKPGLRSARRSHAPVWAVRIQEGCGAYPYTVVVALHNKKKEGSPFVGDGDTGYLTGESGNACCTNA